MFKCSGEIDYVHLNIPSIYLHMIDQCRQVGSHGRISLAQKSFTTKPVTTPPAIIRRKLFIVLSGEAAITIAWTNGNIKLRTVPHIRNNTCIHSETPKSDLNLIELSNMHVYES